MDRTVAVVYETAEEEALHLHAIDELARDIGFPAAKVRPVYEREFLRLKDGAVISSYLVFFAQRRTRAVLGVAGPRH